MALVAAVFRLHAALLLERNPALKPDDVRMVLTRTARDLGARGRDDQFGAGQPDAFAAVTAALGSRAHRWCRRYAGSGRSPERDNASVSLALRDPAP